MWIYVCIFIYVCMCVYMYIYVCTFLFMYVCMYVCMLTSCNDVSSFQWIPRSSCPGAVWPAQCSGSIPGPV